MVAAKVLIVEDDANLLAALKYNLEREGYEVATAVDGIEAVEIARKWKMGLIILDVMLPKLSGFEVCRILFEEYELGISFLGRGQIVFIP